MLFVSLLDGCAKYGGGGTQYLTRTNEVVVFPDRSYPGADTVSYWKGDFVDGEALIVIHLRQQRADFYKGGKLVGVSSISTGREASWTPLGSFKVLQKDKDHISTQYGDYVDEQTGAPINRDVDCTADPIPKGAKFIGARMPYFMRVHEGVGMHQGFLPGYPASHGCIRMPKSMAEAFFRNVEVGTPVRIVE